MNDNEYIRQLGVFEVKITNVQRKEKGEYKGKPFPAKIAVTFEAKDGRVIDGNYRLPLTEPKHKWDAGQLKELMRVCGAEKMSDLKDKEVVIVVSPREYNNKLLWNVQGAFEKRHLLGEAAKLDEALGDIDSLMNGAPNDPDTSDGIPF